MSAFGCGMRISLATKYRILFGTAVVLIIGAALAVPWYYMESMVLQQPFREAQSVAESYFRLVLPARDRHLLATGGVHGGPYALTPESPAPAPLFVPLDFNVDDPQSLLNVAQHDSFVEEAFRTLRKHPSSEFYTRTTWDSERGRRFRYAHAVWVTRRCLECHGEGRSAQPPYQENQLAGLVLVDLPAETSRQSSLINRIVIVAAGVLAGIFAILVFYLITTRFILSPIDELRSVALRVAEGDLSVRSTVQTGDEFEQLSVNLNTMLERLRVSQEELKKANRLLDQKLGEMAETNVTLYEANRLKSEFLANVSHELRTPLTSIIGFAELLREGPSEKDPRTLRYAENILISGRILLEIINDLLDLAKIEAGKSELRLETVSLAHLCSTLIDHIRPLADRRQLVLELEVAEDLPPITTDPGKLRQVLFNLLSNAVKFTPERGRVKIELRQLADGRVRIAVSDTGPGIAPEHQQMIFDKFRQIDQSATREHHGTGLGLAIAKELTSLLTGEIGVDSQLGSGATFWIVLPVSAPEPRERPRPALV
jgi:signal transduction histidine kinase